MKFVFVFGNTPQLSLAELKSQLTQTSILSVPLKDSAGALVEIGLQEAQNLALRLGGTVKLIQLDLPVTEVTATQLADYLLKDRELEKISFGLTDLNDASAKVNSLSRELKSELQSRGIKARFVLPHEGSQLSSVVITKQKVTELALYQSSESLMLGKTIWVQDFEEWNRRDYGRPAVSGHVGMLPPKVARMMLNLAGLQSNEAILDPFCGVGTVLAEALVLGYRPMGSDLNALQVEKTQKNLEWLGQEFSGKFEVKVGDARRVASLFANKFEAVVTEPDLGPNDLRPTYDPQIRNRLTLLYSDSLQEWKKVLSSNGVVVMALPQLASDDSIVRAVIDKAEAMGYSLQAQPVDYFRAGAKVRRAIVVFKRLG